MASAADVSFMLVEDDAMDVMIFERSMRKAGIDSPIIVAGDGREALTILRGHGEPSLTEKSCIVVTDINMPNMDGLNFLSEVRMDSELKSLIVFVLTTSDAPNDKREAYSHNIAGYVLKCTDNSEFMKKIEMLKSYIYSIEF